MTNHSEAINRIGAMPPERVEGPWAKLVLTRRAVSKHGQHRLEDHRPDGSVDQRQGTPPQISRLLKDLRKDMYQPGGSCWYTAVWTVLHNGDGSLDVKATFDYNDEPAWSEPIDPGLYGLDLEDFPRDEDAIPEWLGARLAEARARAK